MTEDQIRDVIAQWRARAASRGAIYASGLLDCADELEALLAERPQPQEDWAERRLREEWWVGHGCPLHALYGDDGEMQCNAPGCRRDFKREPLEALRAHVDMRRLMLATKPLGSPTP